MLYLSMHCPSVREDIYQLNLPFHYDEHSLRSYFENVIGKNVSLIMTENSSSMISVKARSSTVSIRLHRMFLSAGTAVLDEISGFITKRGEKTPHIKKFIRENMINFKSKPKKLKIKTSGRFHDLPDIYNALNRDYFNDAVTAQITWGAKKSRRIVRKRTLGSYCRADRLIRINPLLDSRNVPRYYLEYVVYHEMLHADMDAKGIKDKMHGREFKKREKMFKYYDRALAWEKR